MGKYKVRQDTSGGGRRSKASFNTRVDAVEYKDYLNSREPGHNARVVKK